MPKVFKFFAAIISCLGVMQNGATAGSVAFDYVILNAYDNATDFNPVTIPDVSVNQPGPVLLEMGLRFTPTAGSGERDFRNFAINIGLSSGLTDEFGYAGTPSPVVDIQPGPPVNNQPVFPTNLDTVGSRLAGYHRVQDGSVECDGRTYPLVGVSPPLRHRIPDLGWTAADHDDHR